MADIKKMSIKAKVVNSSCFGRQVERYIGKEVEVIDFVATAQGLYVIAIVEFEKSKEFALFSLDELVIDKA